MLPTIYVETMKLPKRVEARTAVVQLSEWARELRHPRRYQELDISILALSYRFC